MYWRLANIKLDKYSARKCKSLPHTGSFDKMFMKDLDASEAFLRSMNFTGCELSLTFKLNQKEASHPMFL